MAAAAGALRRPAKRGRPALMSAPDLLARIREIAQSQDGLFRIHRTHSAVYARARRQFGSWAKAVRAAGMDYREVVAAARDRATRARRGPAPWATP